MTDSQALPSSPNPVDEGRAVDGLRRTREAQGLSVSEVAHALKLNPRQIEALEAGRFDLLPGFAFTRGFLRNYARLLKIDPAPFLAQLDPPEADANVELAPSSNAQGEMPEIGRGRFRRSVIPGILAALALLGVVMAGWYYDTLRSKPAEELAASLPAPVEAPPPSESAPSGETVTPVPVGAVVASQGDVAVAPQVLPGASAVGPASTPGALSSPVAAPATAEPPKAADGVDRLVFDFSQDAWVEIKDTNGKIVFSRLGKAGSREQVEARAPFSLVIGNARYVKLERNGTPVDLGASTKVTVARLKLN